MYIHKKAMAPDHPSDEGRIWNCPCSQKIAKYHKLPGRKNIFTGRFCHPPNIFNHLFPGTTALEFNRFCRKKFVYTSQTGVSAFLKLCFHLPEQ